MIAPERCEADSQFEKIGQSFEVVRTGNSAYSVVVEAAVAKRNRLALMARPQWRTGWPYVQFGGEGGHVVGQRLESLSGAVHDGAIADAILRTFVIDQTLVRVSSAQFLGSFAPELVRMQLGKSFSIISFWLLASSIRCFQRRPVTKIFGQPA